MIRLPSLRARVFLGALFWTAGLFIGGVLITTILMMRYRHFPTILHGTAYGHAAASSMLTVLFLVLGLMLVRSGLSSVNRLRTRLADVRDGRSRRIEGRYPSEVQPLVDDLNSLLDHRDTAVTRAIAKAGDLAHGLKTPLAILAQEADRVRAAGQLELAEAIGQQVERMRRQTDYHLAQARAAASGATTGTRCTVVESADGLVRTMRRLHADRGLTIEERVPSDHAVRCQREDLDEMLGNLLDNACKWAKARVAVESGRHDSLVRIIVEDDGPGLPASMREAVLQRGVRADEAAPGSGLGLAIVRDLAELYGGSISLDNASTGGLRATLVLPAVDRAAAAESSRVG
jgi:signal transduction histidine kinase